MHSKKIIEYHLNLNRYLDKFKLPKGIQWMYPYYEVMTQNIMTSFYKKYYQDTYPRRIIFGINPGRFGAGVTGVPFTDPIKLKQRCGIDNDLPTKKELSSDFIYAMIDALGGVENFYHQFYITSLLPLGLLKGKLNFNYYDDPNVQSSVTPFIIENIKAQKSLVKSDDRLAYCLGEGKNYQYFFKLNTEHRFFEEIIPLPHPRWIMQYRLKKKEEYIQLYKEKLVV